MQLFKEFQVDRLEPQMQHLSPETKPLNLCLLQNISSFSQQSGAM